MIRRQLRKALPALAHFYGIMPWHIDPDPPELTISELRVFLEALPS